MTSAEEAEAGRVLVHVVLDSDIDFDSLDEDVSQGMGIDGREAHEVFDAFARELALAGFEIVRKP